MSRLIIFTTCKPFIGDDKWRQEQAIKSWIKINIDKIIIIFGIDEGVEEICNKYNLVHIKDIKCAHGVPCVNDLFSISSDYANDNDILLWTNSDMIYFNEDIIKTINTFKKYKEENNIKNYMIVGQRHDWSNPKILDHFDKDKFIANSEGCEQTNEIKYLDHPKHKISIHKTTGVDYIFHNKEAYKNKINDRVVIAGALHDNLLVRIGLVNNYFTCDATGSIFALHENHSYPIERRVLVTNLRNNNRMYAKGGGNNVDASKYKTKIINNEVVIIKK